MVGYRERDGSLVVIEMKKNLTVRSSHRYGTYRTSLLEQGRWCLRFTSDVYCAVLSVPRTKGVYVCRMAGVGVLRVDRVSGMVHRLVDPKGDVEVCGDSRGRLVHALEHKEPGGVGGMPNVRGVGPAQESYDRLVLYKSNYPDATWDEIYRDVPNHYAHAQSMRTSLAKIEMCRAAYGTLKNKPLFNRTRQLLKGEG